MAVSAPRGEVGREHPTEHEPSVGYAGLVVGGEDVVLSDGCWWRDSDGSYVIRSSQFDVIAGGSTFEAALGAFVRNVLDYWAYLAELDDPAENEAEMFRLLSPRLARVAQALARADERPRRRLTLRRHRLRGEQWHTSSKQHGSHLPSPA